MEMRKIKSFIKVGLSFCWHPILSVKLYKKGSRKIYLRGGIQINTCKPLNVGKNVSIGKDARFLFISSYYGSKYKPSVIIGDNVFIGNRFSILWAAPIEIGKNTLIASDVMISSENHGINPESAETYGAVPLDAEPVEIGDGCWLGEKSCIMPGVVLGRRCIVAASAVVTKSFPPYSLVAGVPAKVIKVYNFATHQWESV